MLSIDHTGLIAGMDSFKAKFLFEYLRFQDVIQVSNKNFTKIDLAKRRCYNVTDQEDKR